MGLNLQTAQPQGRHLFAAAPHLATALAIGLMGLGASISPALHRRLAIGLIAALIMLPIYCLLFVIAPAYGAGPS
jgi:hypothetical protein